MSDNDQEKLGLGLGKIPFVMVLSSTFVRGSVFVMLNGPLLQLLFRETREPACDVPQLLREMVSVWGDAVQRDVSAPYISLLLLVSLLSGIALTPIDRFLRYLALEGTQQAYGLVLKFRWILRRKKFDLPRPRARRLPLLSGNVYGKPEYIPLMSWLFRNPDGKGHWEWQFFQDYLYWGFTMNAVIFAVVAGFLAKHASIAQYGILLLIPVPFLCSAFYQSGHMAKVHKYYIERMEKGLREKESGGHSSL